jgi:hypothetical protein
MQDAEYAGSELSWRSPSRPTEHTGSCKVLASDPLDCRGTGACEGDIAADYIATQFALYGLKPAGDQGTYFQNVPMVAVKTLDETSFNFVAPDVGAMTLENLEDS